MVSINCTTEDHLELDQLTEFQGGLKNRTDGDYAKIIVSIQKYGFSFPFFVWAHDGINHVLDGHGRLGALKKLKDQGEVIPPLPVVYVNCGNEENAKNLLLRLNSQYGQMTAESVMDFMAELEFDPYEICLPAGVLDLNIDPPVTVDDDETPERHLDAPAISKQGEIYQLGPHRLMCGDSTSAEDVAMLMAEEKADMVFTDPPYGMKKEAEGIANDNLNYDDLLEFNKKWIPLTFKFMKNNGSWYCWGTDEPLMDIYSNILKPMQKNKQIAFRNLITWDKGSGQGELLEGFRMYPIAAEKCLLVMAGGDSVQCFSVNQEDYSENMDKVRLYLESEIAKLNQNDKIIANALGYKSGRTVNHWRSKSQFALPTRENYEALREYGKTVLKDYDFLKKDYDELKKDYDELKKDYYEGRAYFDNLHDKMTDVWHFKRTNAAEREDAEGHPTPKPLALCARGIKTSSREGEIVLDVFGGSGSTLIACACTGRIARLMELDPHYCDVIRRRWTKWARENNLEPGEGALD